jgi:hypothetical protein
MLTGRTIRNAGRELEVNDRIPTERNDRCLTPG